MSELITIGNKQVGVDHQAYIIAEAGINHNGSLQVAKELCDVAADAGADAVKFQKRSLSDTYIEDVVENPTKSEMGIEYTVSNLKEILLTDEEFIELAAYCENKKIQFLCSPWDVTSVDFLEELGLPAYKIGSPDMTNFILLERVMETGKPIFISTGMAEENEIERTTQFLSNNDATYGLLHCRSTYPAPFHNLNLSYMEELAARYDVPVGYSGHERGIAVSEAAVALGADIVERHFTLDRTMEGPDHAASLEPTGLRKLVRDIRNIETSMGTPARYLTRGEYNNKKSLGKSLATTRAIENGEELTRDALTAKSPAKGISPQYLYDIVGEVAQKPIPTDKHLQWEDITQREAASYDTSLDNWGVVVRFSDISKHDWGEPDVFEFRINGSDLDANLDPSLCDQQFEQQLGVHAPEQKGHDLVDLSAQNESTRRKAVEIMQSVIDLTHESIEPAFLNDDPPKIVVHPGGVTTDHMELEATAEMNEALAQSMSELEAEAVDILLENMPPLPWIYGGQQYHNNFMRADEIAEYCDRTGQRICYDTSHAKLWCNYSDTDLVEHAKTLRPYIDYLHVADAAGVDGEGLQIGDGEIDFERLAPVFEDFDGPVVTEIWRGHEKQGEGFKKAASELKAYF